MTFEDWQTVWIVLWCAAAVLGVSAAVWLVCTDYHESLKQKERLLPNRDVYLVYGTSSEV